jgi:hypothetical protein
LKTVKVFRVLLAILLAAILAAQKLPPAEFSGSIHGVSKNHLVLETAEGNLIDFDVNGKTQVLRGKKKIELEDLKTGEAVTIEARQEPSRYQVFLMALTITASGKPKD